MTSNWIVYACLLLGFSSALVAGVFQAFSDFVMRGLIRAESAAGIETMQHINRTVMRSLFLFTFLALAPLSLCFACYAWFELDGHGRWLILFAAGTYLTMVFCITIFGNVPMNERLAGLAHTSGEAEQYWHTYGRIWTLFNNVRTIGSCIASGSFLLAAISFA